MNIRLNKWFIGAAALVLGVTAVSCEDEPDKFEPTSGVPVVKYVRVCDPNKSDSLVVGAYLNNTICLVGDNLTSIHEMYFNEHKAILNTSYITDHTLIVDVPNEIPYEVTDKIYMINWANDTITYDFKVQVPAPVVSSMSCEWVAPGDEAVLYGDYFIDDENVPMQITMPGNISVPHENIKSVTKTSVTFKVPEDATETGQITMSTLYGTGRGTFMYHDNRGILFDFDGATSLDFTSCCWHAQEAKTDEWSLTGAYVQLGADGVTVPGDILTDGWWDDNNFALQYWPGSWDLDVNKFPAKGQVGCLVSNYADFSDWENMSLKFEMCVPSSNPWKSGSMQIVFAGYDKVQLRNANNDYYQDDELPRALYRPWTTTGTYDTANKWVTVTIPFSTGFVYGWNGGKATGKLTSKDFNTFLMFVCAGGVNGTECQPIIKIDNIRAVPNL
jgi:hypothetical protein